MRMLFLTCCSLGVFHSGYACQYTPNANELAQSLEDRDWMRQRAIALATEADRIFIGTLDESSRLSATFRDIVNLKGSTEENVRLEWTEADEVIVSCGGVFSFLNFLAPEKKDYPVSYLVYAKGDHLLRINEVGSFAEALSGYEELEWLRDARHIEVR